jgi:hypothetical protein
VTCTSPHLHHRVVLFGFADRREVVVVAVEVLEEEEEEEALAEAPHSRCKLCQVDTRSMGE